YIFIPCDSGTSFAQSYFDFDSSPYLRFQLVDFTGDGAISTAVSSFDNAYFTAPVSAPFPLRSSAIDSIYSDYELAEYGSLTHLKQLLGIVLPELYSVLESNLVSNDSVELLQLSPIFVDSINTARTILMQIISDFLPNIIQFDSMSDAEQEICLEEGRFLFSSSFVLLEWIWIGLETLNASPLHEIFQSLNLNLLHLHTNRDIMLILIHEACSLDINLCFDLVSDGFDAMVADEEFPTMLPGFSAFRTDLLSSFGPLSDSNNVKCDLYSILFALFPDDHLSELGSFVFSNVWPEYLSYMAQTLTIRFWLTITTMNRTCQETNSQGISNQMSSFFESELVLLLDSSQLPVIESEYASSPLLIDEDYLSSSSSSTDIIGYSDRIITQYSNTHVSSTLFSFVHSVADMSINIDHGTFSESEISSFSGVYGIGAICDLDASGFVHQYLVDEFPEETIGLTMENVDSGFILSSALFVGLFHSDVAESPYEFESVRCGGGDCICVEMPMIGEQSTQSLEIVEQFGASEASIIISSGGKILREDLNSHIMIPADEEEDPFIKLCVSQSSLIVVAMLPPNTIVNKGSSGFWVIFVCGILFLTVCSIIVGFFYSKYKRKQTYKIMKTSKRAHSSILKIDNDSNEEIIILEEIHSANGFSSNVSDDTQFVPKKSYSTDL
ncbi:hypothetical protein ADUPG1_007949, partial [Aduncisulcus paluster]